MLLANVKKLSTIWSTDEMLCLLLFIQTLLVTMPAINLRIKIQEEQITDYRAAVERAQALEEILHNENNLQAYPHLHSHLNLYLQNS